MHKFASLAISTVVLTGCLSIDIGSIRVNDATLGGGDSGFIAFSTDVQGEEQPAVVFVPDGYDPDRKWPLVVFLHGMGERGSDGWRQTDVGIGKAIRWNPQRFPCLVLMPQCSESTTWSSADNPDGAPASKHIDAAIEHVLKKYNIDEDRVSLTGLSMGGYGTFTYGAENIERFSALMPVCGGGNPDNAAALAKRPMWVFHGGADPVVNPDQSRRMVEAVRNAGGGVQYTEYPGVGHNSWDNAYGDEEAIDWLLTQSR